MQVIGGYFRKEETQTFFLMCYDFILFEGVQTFAFESNSLSSSLLLLRIQLSVSICRKYWRLSANKWNPPRDTEMLVGMATRKSHFLATCCASKQSFVNRETFIQATEQQIILIRTPMDGSVIEAHINGLLFSPPDKQKKLMSMTLESFSKDVSHASRVMGGVLIPAHQHEHFSQDYQLLRSDFHYSELKMTNIMRDQNLPSSHDFSFFTT